MSRPLPTILYLCDGKIPECEKTCCSYNGTGECRHTERWDHALHKDADLNDFIARSGRVKGEVNLWLWEPFDEG